MYKKLILHSLFFFLISSVVLSPVFAELEFESGPLEQKPLDEREQEDQDIMDVWIYAIIIVVIMLIARLGFRVIKKRRRSKKKDYRTDSPSKQSAHKSSCVVNPFGIFNPRFLQSETENFRANLPNSFLHL